MITVICGEDILSSRNKIQELLNTSVGYEIIKLDAILHSLTDIIGAVESQSLLADDKLIVIENLFSLPASKNKLQILTLLKNNENLRKIIIWEGKQISRTDIYKFFQKPVIFNFPIGVNIFRFLDSVGIAGTDEILHEFHKLLKSHQAELIYAMLLRQYRLLILSKDKSIKNIPNLSSWQIAKLNSHAAHFDLQYLIRKYRLLLQIDISIKSGTTVYSVADLLDFFLINL